MKANILLGYFGHRPLLRAYSSLIKDGEACHDAGKDDEDEEEEEISSAGRVGAEQKYDEAMDEAEEEIGLKRYREARSHEMFPDEVDTPLDVSARTR